MGARIENKINSSDKWMRIRCIIEFFTFDSGVAALSSDDQESTRVFRLIIKTFKNNMNSLVFGDFLQNSQGFIGFIYQANGYIDSKLTFHSLIFLAAVLIYQTTHARNAHKNHASMTVAIIRTPQIQEEIKVITI